MILSRKSSALLLLTAGLLLAVPAFAQNDAPANPAPDAPAAPPPKPVMEDRDTAVLQALDKVTARVSTLEVRVGDTVKFNSLAITVRACRQPPPLEAPESAAFLKIMESAPGGEEPTEAFQGWMFASSPALSAMEDPVYDVWVLECKNAATSAPSSPAPAKPAAPAPAAPGKLSAKPASK